MNTKTAMEMIGEMVQVKDVQGWGGKLVAVNGGWATIKSPTLDGRGRIDEVQVSRLEIDPT